jgi:hypothetical protein
MTPKCRPSFAAVGAFYASPPTLVVESSHGNASLLKVVAAFRPSPNLVQEEAGKMTVDELVRFNPILANAFAKFEAENDPEVSGCMQSLVAVAVKTGVEPEKIYATIKTGRMLTTENRKFLSKAELKEWQDAGEEYRRLAKRHEKKRVKKA